MKTVSFVTKYWGRLLVFIGGPVCACVVARLLVMHTNGMAYDLCNVRRWPSGTCQSCVLPDDCPSTPGTFVLRSLLFVTVMLILPNTIVYFKEIWDRQQAAALPVYVLSLAVVIAWPFEICFGFLTNYLTPVGSHLAVHLNEIIAILLFVFFGIMDYQIYRKVTQSLTGSTQQLRFEEVEKQTYLFQVLAVDVPVATGIAGALLITHYALEGSPALGPLAPIFHVGFLSGALTMHLAISQAIFFGIYCRYFYYLYQAHQPKQSPNREPEKGQTA